MIFYKAIGADTFFNMVRINYNVLGRHKRPMQGKLPPCEICKTENCLYPIASDEG